MQKLLKQIMLDTQYYKLFFSLTFVINLELYTTRKQIDKIKN